MKTESYIFNALKINPCVVLSSPPLISERTWYTGQYMCTFSKRSASTLATQRRSSRWCHQRAFCLSGGYLRSPTCSPPGNVYYRYILTVVCLYLLRVCDVCARYADFAILFFLMFWFILIQKAFCLYSVSSLVNIIMIVVHVACFFQIRVGKVSQQLSMWRDRFGNICWSCWKGQE